MPTPSEYRTIPLTQGQIVLVDVQDYTRLAQFKWTSQWNKPTHSFYAYRKESIGKRRISVLMHRSILGLNYGDSLHVDHLNHDTLDNRRSNIRIVTRSENMQNIRLRANSASGIQGVTWRKDRGLWQIRKTLKGKQFHLGYSTELQQAKRIIEDFCAANVQDSFRAMDDSASTSSQIS